MGERGGEGVTIVSVIIGALQQIDASIVESDINIREVGLNSVGKGVSVVVVGVLLLEVMGVIDCFSVESMTYSNVENTAD